MTGDAGKFRNVTVGMDMGNTATKISVDRGLPGVDPEPLELQGVSGFVTQPSKGRSYRIPIIPSLIHYADDGAVFVGCEVEDRGLSDSDGTVCWMARQVALDSPVCFRVGRRELTYQVAASDFLSSIIHRLGEQMQLNKADLVVAVPPGSTDQFRKCLSHHEYGAVIGKVIVIESPEAAIGSSLPGNMIPEVVKGGMVMIIDFGGSQLEISLMAGHTDQGDIRWRSLGRTVSSLGGRDLDRLIMKMTGCQIPVQAQKEGDLSREIRIVSRAVKEALSVDEETDLTLPGKTSVRIKRRDFEDILSTEGVYARISSTLEQTLAVAASRGYSEHSLCAIILAGGSSCIPSVERYIKARFKGVRIFSERPVDCAARGAALFRGGLPMNDRIVSDYAIRVWNPETARFELRTIIRRGCRVPTDAPIARFRIQAAYDGQTRLGIPLYCMNHHSETVPPDQERELRYLESGVVEVIERQESHRSYYMNPKPVERGVLLIPADPPARVGDPRFEIRLSVNHRGELLVSATDLHTGRLVLKDAKPEIHRLKENGDSRNI